METSPILYFNAIDEDGDLLESREASKVIDVNIKGTLNSSSSHHISHSPLHLC